MNIEDHFPLVRRIANQAVRGMWSEDAEDLFQAGVIGLIRASETWDPSRGAAFSTFAHTVVLRSIWDAIRCNGYPYKRHSVKFAGFLGDTQWDLEDPNETPEDTLNQKQTNETLEDVITDLDEEDRKLLRVAYWKDPPKLGSRGVSWKRRARLIEAAKQLGVHRATASRRHKRIIAYLQERL